jgi:hypothetical protein
MKKTTFLAFCLTVSVQAYSDTFEIVRVGVDLSQQTFFVGVNPSAINSPCGRKDEFKWNLSASGIKEIETIAIAAKSMGKKLMIGVDPTNCVAGQATGFFVYIE